MSESELSQLKQQIDLLQQVVINLVTLQREVLTPLQSQAVGASGASCSTPNIYPILTQLNQLCERLERYPKETAENTPDVDEPPPLRLKDVYVERLNIVEPGGVVRMILCNSPHSPGHVMDGKVIGKLPGQREAGIYFFDDEGNECGGLIYGGKHDENGYYTGGSLTFDQYRQDQVIGLQHDDANGKRSAGLRVWDRPDISMDEWVKRVGPIFNMPDGPEQQAAIRQLQESGLIGVQRVFVGKGVNRDAAVCLFDVKGRVRLRLAVDAGGTPVLEFLDEGGRITATLPETPSDRRDRQ